MSKVEICGVDTSDLKRLTYRESEELLARIKEGDEGARETFALANVRLVLSVIRRFPQSKVSSDDLFQAGMIGLMKSIDNFDLSVGVRFSTYAVPMIVGEIKRFLRDDGSLKVSRVIKSQALRINRFIESYRGGTGEGPSVEEIASALNIDREDVVLALDSSRMPLSLYEKTDDSGDNKTELIDKIPSGEREEDMIDRILLKSMIESLPPRERKVIVMRYYRDKTQSEIARALGISQVQVSRIEYKIIASLKEKI